MKIIPTIKGFDEKIQSDYNGIQDRRTELSVRLANIKDEIGQVKKNRAAVIASGADDCQEFDDRLTELRSAQEGLQDAIDHLSNEAARIKRSNSWIK